MATCTPSATLSQRIAAGCDENPLKCYQCKRCTAGCPVARHAGLHPAQVMRAVQLGQTDLVFADRFIWLCTGCQTCSTRCPQGIDVAAVIDELKIMAYEQGKVPPDAPFANLLRLNHESILRWGRLYEVELLARDRLTRPAALLDDVGLGLRMLARGKLALLPERGDVAAVRRMAQAAERVTRARRAGKETP
jgi:heterodisulfide reductase subunit C